MKYLYELVDLLNRYDGENSETENRIRDLVCYISDDSEKMKIDIYRRVVFEAAEKLRMFGYIKGIHKINSNEFEEGALFDIKHSTIQNFYRSKVFSNNLLDKRQKEVIDIFMNLSDKRILVSAPTSFGKTYLLREIIFLNREKYRNILLVFPTIALLNENTESINQLISSFKLEYNIVNNVYTGIDVEEKHIFILTPERTLKLLADNSSMQIDFFFFDEVYKIDEDFDKNEDSDSKKESGGNRAKAFRIALYLLAREVKEYYLAGPYLNLTGIKDGMRKFIEINRITTFQVEFEPTLRIEYDAWKKTSVEKHPVLGEAKREMFEGMESLSTKEKVKGIVSYLQNENLGQAIFYCATPAKSMDYTKDIIQSFNFVEKSNISSHFIDHLKKKYNVKYGANQDSYRYWSLITALEHGVGIHHGKFPKYIQNEIMKMFNEGVFDYLFCTSTIIEGVNTNAKNVIIINNSVGGSVMTAFALKNIKGRAGRYYHHYIGRVFYTDKQQRKIELSDEMKLNFQTYDDVKILNADIDNAQFEDLSTKNKMIKGDRESTFNKNRLPDKVFAKNRLYPRDVQEKYLGYLLENDNFSKFSVLINNSGNIRMFLERRMINSILESFEETGIVEVNKVKVYCGVLNQYSINGTLSILQYHVNNLQSDENGTLEEKMDKAYIKTFEQIRNIVEYEIPKLLCLFEALYQRAGELLNYDMSKFNLSAVIRYFELGITTELGLYLVEYGFPIDTIRNLEKVYYQISSMTAREASILILNDFYRLQKVMDSYEIDLFQRAISALGQRRSDK